jgi:hypothetical protein
VLALDEQLADLQEKQMKVDDESFDDKTALDEYKQLLNLKKQLHSLGKEDRRYVDLKDQIENEKSEYLSLAMEVLNQRLGDTLLKPIIQAISMNQGRYQVVDGVIRMEMNVEAKIAEMESSLMGMAKDEKLQKSIKSHFEKAKEYRTKQNELLEQITQ